MKQTLSILFTVVALLITGTAVAATPNGQYEALLAGGKTHIQAVQLVLQDLGEDPDAVGSLVTRVIADTGDPATVVAAAVEALMPLGKLEPIEAAVRAALDAGTSPEQLLETAVAAYNAVEGDSEFAEEVREAIVRIALEYGIDPALLLAATAAIPGANTSFGNGAGAPGSGSGGGVGSPN